MNKNNRKYQISIKKSNTTSDLPGIASTCINSQVGQTKNLINRQNNSSYL